MSKIIKQRNEVEVYLGQNGDVCIKQTDAFEDDSIVILPPQDIPQLIKFLQEVFQEAFEEQ